MKSQTEISGIVISHYGSEYGILPLEADPVRESEFESGPLLNRKEIRGLLPGRFHMLPPLSMDDLREGGDVLPAVGDLVSIVMIHQECLIQSVGRRRSILSRKEAGRSSASQIMACNVDLIWIVMPADRPMSDGGLLRYLNVAGSIPARVAITKCDLVKSRQDLEETVERLSRHLPVDRIHLLSMEDRQSVESLKSELRDLKPLSADGPPVGLTCFLGPSGAGKSTLVNALLGIHRQDVSHISKSTGKGRHTTTTRDWILHPDGYAILDTPGMRELGLDSLPEEGPFGLIQELATQCRFNDCRHETEKGCQVQAALQRGELDAGLLESYRSMSQEVARVEEFRKKRKKPVADEAREARKDAKEKWEKEITMKIRKGPKKRN